ncbi:MAG: hypothetical protein EA370_11635 [Wenzhouxiangella sp.]|nr:MAG: hypothetical protein EA370_11635 [Wenzhouxiangella sp.]
MSQADSRLLSDIARTDDVAGLRRLAPQVPALLVTLVEGGQPTQSVAKTISAVGEAISRRLLELAEQKLGPPPVAYAFVVAGSQARREQIAGSDQDNALVLANDFRRSEHDQYFLALARLVCEPLHDCGYARCPGDIMASNSNWRLSLSEWQNRFRRWIEEPDPQALLRLGIFFDLRHQYGDAELVRQLRKDFLARTRAAPLFQAYLAAAAQGFRPALGWLGRLRFQRDDDGIQYLDLKPHGVQPVVEIARTHTLAMGIDCLNTVERFQALRATGEFDSGEIDGLLTAFDLINALRQSHQVRRIRAGLQPDYRVPGQELSAADRRGLKQAFRVISAAQQALLRRYRAEEFR